MDAKQYEILEHTGDAKIKAFGKTKEELFLNAMLGMSGLIGPKLKTTHSTSSGQENEKVKRTIKVESPDINSLLVDFLSEVNYLAQTEREAYGDAKFLSFSDTYLEVELSGQKAEEFGEEIKAVTHHGLEIKQNADGLWEAYIVFDI